MNKIDMNPIANKIAEDTELIKSIEEKLVKQTFTINVDDIKLLKNKKVVLINEP